MQSTLSGKYIICSCEGSAEKTVIDLLLDNSKLCFTRDDLINRSCTTLHKAEDIARKFLNCQKKKRQTIKAKFFLQITFWA